MNRKNDPEKTLCITKWRLVQGWLKQIEAMLHKRIKMENINEEIPADKSRGLSWKNLTSVIRAKREKQQTKKQIEHEQKLKNYLQARPELNIKSKN